MTAKKEWTRCTVNLEKEEYETLRVLASANNKSVSRFVRDFLSACLEEWSPEVASLVNKLHKADKS